MGIAQALARRTEMRVASAARSGFERLAARVAAAGGVPLEIALPDGARLGFGLPARVRLVVREPSLLAELASPSFATLGEAYVHGRLDVQGDLLDALPMAERLVEVGGAGLAQRMAALFVRHTARTDRSAITYHYDVGNAFYQLWLDERMVYSCAYFRTGEETLDEAQRAKLDHICRKLRLLPGERLLDVGCGWGGLVIHAAQHYGVSAVGITLSKEQHALARERVAELGLSDRVRVELLDYRELVERFGRESFDKAASIGMFEHVGLKNLAKYFASVAAVLRDRGLFLNHGITATDVENRPVGGGVSDFIERYVFPHGELPHLHLAVREMAAASFEVVDVESLRAHYAKTLEHWSRRLESRLDEAARLVSDRTLRIWRAYLAGCSYGFQQGWVSIHQLLGSVQRRPGNTALPLTREWMYRADQR
ncbi:MAG TPA: class I SAM-dependent methyltransferase [Burkholderiaceae bacterium]|nr:class I SAM-dependent methyltransferase [Burkholderiaceae bacterium]